MTVNEIDVDALVAPNDHRNGGCSGENTERHPDVTKALPSSSSLKKEDVTKGGDRKGKNAPLPESSPSNSKERRSSYFAEEIDDLSLISDVQPLPSPQLRPATATRQSSQSLPGAYAERTFRSGSLPPLYSSPMGNNRQSSPLPPALAGNQSNRSLGGLVRATPVDTSMPQQAQPVLDDPEQALHKQGKKSQEDKRLASPMIVCLIWLVVLAVALLCLGLSVSVNTSSTKVIRGAENDETPTEEEEEKTALDALQLDLLPNLPNYTLETLRSDINGTSPQYRAFLWLQNDPWISNYSQDRRLQRFAAATFYYATGGDYWTNVGGGESIVTYGLGFLAATGGGDSGDVESSNGGEGGRQQGGGGGRNGTVTSAGRGNAVGGGGGRNNTGGGGAGRESSGDRLNNPDSNDNTRPGGMPAGNSSKPGGGREGGRDGSGNGRPRGNGTLAVPNDNDESGDEGESSEDGRRDNDKDRVEIILAEQWLSYEHNECEWFSVPDPIPLCRDETFVNLNLFRNNLTQTIPPEIQLFTNLESLRLHQNPLVGTILTEIGSMISLRDLSLRGNEFMTGEIPSQIGRLTNLRMFAALGSGFRGTLPQELFRLSNLVDLKISRNGHAGTIPEDIGFHMSSLSEVLLSFNNDLSGSLPTSLGLCSNLVNWNVADNRMTGTLPTELGMLKNLTKLSLNQNRFSGMVPSEFGMLSSVERLHVDRNREIYGPVPTELGLLNNTLSFLNIKSTSITGTIPEELCGIERLAFDCSEVLCGCDCPCQTF